MERRARVRAAAAGLFLVVLCAAAQSRARTFYVATDGNDSHNGLAPAREKGSRGPFRTLMRAARAVRAGDTVLIRGGTYRAGSTWTADGTEARPITISNYGGEPVVIDGDGFKIPGGGNDVLLQVYGDWCGVSNLEVRHSSGYGVAVHGRHCRVDNVYAHDNWGSGIYITGWHGLLVNCRASRNSLLNEKFRPHEGTWGFGISACRHPQYTTIRGCTSWDNWGEGISTFESHHITIEDCVSYNNQQNYYISDTKYCLFRRNLSYFTPGNPIQGYVTQNGILIGDEKRNPASSDNVFINNLVLGGERNLAAGGNQLRDCLVANNTFVDASPTAGAESACVYFFGGCATGARFVNNIVSQQGSTAVSRLEAKGISFRRNNWSRRPVSGCRGAGDVLGDPGLLKAGPAGPGAPTVEWFRISPGSPARDRAERLGEVQEDATRTPRLGKPDIGALEAPAFRQPARPR